MPAPEASSSGVFRYVKGQWLSIDFDMKEDQWNYRLKVKAFKVQAWFEERAKKYSEEGYSFLPACITFRSWDEFIEFERRGGRRAFVKEWKRSSKKGEIKDYVAIMEFQERGVPHYHFLLVVKGWIEYPEKIVTYKGLGIASLERRIKRLDRAKRYLQGYIKKMSQIRLEQYYELVTRLGGRKQKVRLYDFGRGTDSRRLFSALGKGWIRVIYSKFLRRQWDWRYDNGWLEYLRIRVKALWDGICHGRKFFAEFKGFLVELLSGEDIVVFEVESLDNIVLGWERLREALIGYG